MGKVRLRAEGKSREEAFGKLVKLAKFYPKHVFKTETVFTQQKNSIYYLEVEGELDD